MRAAGLLLVGAMLGCSPHHDLPSLSTSPIDSGTAPVTEPPYPKAAAYGARVGDVVPDLTFEGYRARSNVWEAVSLHDYYDPTGEKGIRYLLLVSAVAWCPACNVAAKALSQNYDHYESQGVRIIHMLREKVDTSAADRAIVDAWRSKYAIQYDNLLDEKQQSFSLIPAEMRVTPYISIVDARTMKVVKERVFVEADGSVVQLDELL